jgi:hypothetical protein
MRVFALLSYLSYYLYLLNSFKFPLRSGLKKLATSDFQKTSLQVTSHSDDKEKVLITEIFSVQIALNISVEKQAKFSDQDSDCFNIIRSFFKLYKLPLQYFYGFDGKELSLKIEKTAGDEMSNMTFNNAVLNNVASNIVWNWGVNNHALWSGLMTNDFVLNQPWSSVIINYLTQSSKFLLFFEAWNMLGPKELNLSFLDFSKVLSRFDVLKNIIDFIESNSISCFDLKISWQDKDEIKCLMINALITTVDEPI